MSDDDMGMELEPDIQAHAEQGEPQAIALAALTEQILRNVGAPVATGHVMAECDGFTLKQGDEGEVEPVGHSENEMFALAVQSNGYTICDVAKEIYDAEGNRQLSISTDLGRPFITALFFGREGLERMRESINELLNDDQSPA